MNEQQEQRQLGQAIGSARPRSGRTPWAPPPRDGRVPTLPWSGPADQPARGPAGFVRRSPDSERPLCAVDLAPRPAALVHELAVAAEPGGDEARELARRLAASLSPEVRLVLLSALAEAGASPDDDRPTAYGTGSDVSCDAPERTVTPALSGLSFLPTYQEDGPDRPVGDRESGDREFWQAAGNEPPSGVIRLRFADAIALERAGAAFRAGSGPGFGDARSDPTTLTLQIPGDAGVDTLRAVLAVLDEAAITAESLTVHTHALDDVLAAFTVLP